MNKDQAISLLTTLFNDHKLTFRQIQLLKEVFDLAVEETDEYRQNLEAEYHQGRGPHPVLPSKDTEDDFYLTMANKARDRIKQPISEATLNAIVDFAVEEAEYTPKDFYYV